MCEIKEMSASQPLSILCRNWQDISTYTLGFPAVNTAGQVDTFRLTRQMLPGPVSLTLSQHPISLSLNNGTYLVPGTSMSKRDGASVIAPLQYISFP